MTHYEQLIKSIDIKKYNKWIQEDRVVTEDARYWMLSGIRLLTKHQEEKYPNEMLPPLSKAEQDYYDKIK